MPSRKVKTLKKGKEDFISFNSKINLPLWVYISIKNKDIPSCKDIDDKIAFIITYYIMTWKR